MNEYFGFTRFEFPRNQINLMVKSGDTWFKIKEVSTKNELTKMHR